MVVGTASSIPLEPENTFAEPPFIPSKVRLASIRASSPSVSTEFEIASKLIEKDLGNFKIKESICGLEIPDFSLVEIAVNLDSSGTSRLYIKHHHSIFADESAANWPKTRAFLNGAMLVEREAEQLLQLATSRVSELAATLHQEAQKKLNERVESEFVAWTSGNNCVFEHFESPASNFSISICKIGKMFHKRYIARAEYQPIKNAQDSSFDLLIGSYLSEDAAYFTDPNTAILSKGGIYLGERPELKAIYKNFH